MVCRTKLQLDSDDLIKSDQLEKQIAIIQTSVEELEAWHTRTSNFAKADSSIYSFHDSF